MQVTSRAQIKEDGFAEYGFKLPSEGLHGFIITEGIDVKISQDGKRRITIPAKVYGGDEDGRGIFISCPEGDFGESRLCDILVLTEQAEHFERKFSDDLSFFDPKVLIELKIKLLNKMLSIDVFHSEGDGKTFANVKRIGKFGGSAPKPAATSAPRTVPDGETEDAFANV